MTLGEDLRPLPKHLREAPDQLASRPIVDEDTLLLPFLKMPWRNFERLNLVVAERCDGLRDAMEYGTRGEKQDGIDFVGQLGSEYRAYQVRRLEKRPTATNVRTAVEEFLRYRPLGATSFVLCTAQPANQRDVVDEIARLREKHPDMDIQVRGAERLTVLLSEQPDLVSRFFNDQYRERFCGVPPRSPSVSTATEEPTVDVVLRGPIKALKLDSVLHSAETAQDPLERAAAYRTLAENLEGGPYRSFARRMRQSQAESLLAAGDTKTACEVWLEVAADMVEAGLAPPAPGAMFQARDHAAGTPEHVGARLDAVEGLIEWHRDGPIGIDRLRKSADRLRSLADSWLARVMLWWAESCLVDEFFDAVREAVDELSDLAQKVTSEDIAVRLRLALCDVTGDWQAIERKARLDLLSGRNAGLVFARRGRILAWTGDAAGALDAYRQAIEPLMRDGLQGDVRACLESIRRVQLVYRPLGEIEETTGLLTTVSSGKRRFGEVVDARRTALESLRAEKWPSAHEDIRRFLWEARISGHLEDEFRGREMLGDLYARTQLPEVSAANYMRAGEVKAAAGMAATVAEPLNVLPEMSATAPWLRASALAVVAADGDRRQAESIGDIARATLEAIHAVPASPFAPQVWVEAFAALAGIVLQLDDELAVAALNLVEPLVERPANQYRPIDDQILRILTGIYDAHPDLRDRVRNALIKGLSQSGLANGATDALVERLPADAQLRVLVEQTADSGDTAAALVLGLSGVGHQSALQLAEQRVTGFLATPMDRDPAVIKLAPNVGIVAALARLLPEQSRERVAERLLAMAAITSDLELNRGSALLGLGALADDFPEERRAGLFIDILRFADPDIELSPFDAFARASSHPLSATRIQLGDGDLRRSALLAASRYARRREQVEALRANLRELLASPRDADLNAAARMILILGPLDANLVDIEDLAIHPSPHLRSVAAWFLTHGRVTNAELCRKLVSDTDGVVRRAMAVWLPALEKRDSSLAQELRAILTADRSARIRLAAMTASDVAAAVSA